MQSVPIAYTIAGTTSLPYAQAVERVRDELVREGFGVLTEIDVQTTLREKLGEEVDPYVILGACNPSSAHRALGPRSGRRAASRWRQRVRSRRGHAHRTC